MKVTVAILTRDRLGQLKRCLTSLVRQTRRPNEVLLIDTPKAKSAKSLVTSFKKRLPIRYVLEKRIGIAVARNRAIQETKNAILAFLDDDCEAYKDWVQQILGHHKKYSKSIAIQGWSKNIPATHYQAIISQFNLEYGLRSKKDQLIDIIDTRNVSFKVKMLTSKNIWFNEELQGFDEIELAKRLIFLNETVQFCPSIKVDHWERGSTKKFLIKRFKMGFWRQRIYKRWESYMPKWSIAWYVKRWYLFLSFYLRDRYPVSLLPLMLFFLAENFIFFLGSLYGKIAPKNIQLTNDSSFSLKIN